MIFLTEAKNDYSTTVADLSFPTVFKDNTEYDSFMVYVRMRRNVSQNFSQLQVELIDDSGTIIADSNYYQGNDNHVGTYRNKTQRVSATNLLYGSMGTNNARDNSQAYLWIGNPYVSGKLTTLKSVSGGNYQGSSSTYNNGSVQFIGGMGWLQDTQLVGGFNVTQSGSPVSQKCFVKVFGIKES